MAHSTSVEGDEKTDNNVDAKKTRMLKRMLIHANAIFVVPLIDVRVQTTVARLLIIDLLFIANKNPLKKIKSIRKNFV